MKKKTEFPFLFLIADGSVLDGIAIDHYGRNMFWTASTDNDSNRIEVAKLDGSHRKILISHNLDEPRDICLVSLFFVYCVFQNNFLANFFLRF